MVRGQDSEQKEIWNDFSKAILFNREIFYVLCYFRLLESREQQKEISTFFITWSFGSHVEIYIYHLYMFKTQLPSF